MVITDVRIRKINNDGRMRAIVSVTLNDEFVIHDVRVIEGNNGLFVAMPSKRTPSGEFKDIAHPITSAAREKNRKSGYRCLPSGSGGGGGEAAKHEIDAQEEEDNVL